MPRPRSEEKIEAIYQATLTLVLREGFTGLKMPEVAKLAGIATGSIYTYFESKERLISELYLYLKARAAKQMTAEYDENQPFIINFRKLWFAFLNVSLQNPEASAFLEQYYRSPYLDPAVKTEADRLLGPIFDTLERGKRELLVKNLPLELLTAQLTGPIENLVKLRHDAGFELTAAHFEAAYKMAWDGIRN